MRVFRILRPREVEHDCNYKIRTPIRIAANRVLVLFDDTTPAFMGSTPTPRRLDPHTSPLLRPKTTGDCQRKNFSGWAEDDRERGADGAAGLRGGGTQG